MDLLAPNKNMNAMTEMNDIDCSPSIISERQQLKIGLLTLLCVCYVYRDEMLCCQILCCCFRIDKNETKNPHTHIHTHTRQMSFTVASTCTLALRCARSVGVNVIQQFVCRFFAVAAVVGMHGQSHGCNFLRVRCTSFVSKR